MKAILTYHSIDDSGSPVSVGERAWHAHHQWLLSGRVLALTLDEIASHPADGADAVAVTFDDGCANTRTALQDLRSDGIPVTVFVVTGHVGGSNAWGGRPQAGIPTLPLLGWRELEDLVSRGTAMGCHTQRHRRLIGLSEAEVDEELRGGADDLEGHFGVRAADIAYPYGAVDDTVAARAARHFRRWLFRF